MLRKNHYPGRIYPINPNYGELDGLKCYPSISDVGQPIDLAIVIIPARAVLGALEQCAAVGVKNAVIISSGFAEEGGDSAAMPWPCSANFNVIETLLVEKRPRTFTSMTFLPETTRQTPGSTM